MENLWIRKPQECSGSYMFSGKLFTSSGVSSLLSEAELNAIVADVKAFVKENDGMDYLIVYEHLDTKQKLFFIDQLNREMIASGEYKPEYNHATLILAEEY